MSKKRIIVISIFGAFLLATIVYFVVASTADVREPDKSGTDGILVEEELRTPSEDEIHTPGIEKVLITEESIHTDFFDITLPKRWVRNVFLTEEIEGEAHIYKFLAKDCADAREDILLGTLLSVYVSKNEEDIISLNSLVGGYRFSSDDIYALAFLPTDIQFTDETQEVYMRLQDELMNEIGGEIVGLKKLFTCK